MNTPAAQTVPQFISQLPPLQQLLAGKLRQLIRKTVPTATEAIKWKMPVFEQAGLLCALRPAKDYLALQFYSSGSSLADPEKLLAGSGKGCRHYKLRSLADFRPQVLSTWLVSAAAFNLAALQQADRDKVAKRSKANRKKPGI